MRFLILKQLLGEILGRQRGAADGRLGDCGCVFEDSIDQGEGTEYVCGEVLSLICEKISTFTFQRVRFLLFLLCPAAMHSNQ